MRVSRWQWFGPRRAGWYRKGLAPPAEEGRAQREERREKRVEREREKKRERERERQRHKHDEHERVEGMVSHRGMQLEADSVA